MPNSLAFAALTLWPVASLILFHRLPVGRAVIASLFLAYLFLPPPPAGLDLPLLPPLTKETIPSLVAFLICLVMYRDRVDILPQSFVARLLMVVFVFTPVITVLTNTETVYFGIHSLPAMQLSEIPGMLVQQTILLLPFVLGRSFLKDDTDIRDMVLALFIGGMVYSLPMLAEVRLSPQINIWIYGYFQHDFAQMMRQGGFRPIVFLTHGLMVAFFAMTAVLAAVALMRSENGRGIVFYGVSAVYLFAVLVLCKSVGSLLYGIALAPLVLLFGQRTLIGVALVLGMLALAYPAAKGLHLVPQDEMLHLANAIDPDRAASLQYRLDNETILLDRAMEKPLFGWGGWGRNQIMDPDSGRVITVTDGRWVIVIGVYGWLGLIAEFGLLLFPLAMIGLKFRSGYEPPSVFVGPLILIVAINVVDLIPNATITPLTWLFAGALLGYAESHVPKRLQIAPSFRTVL